jgi:hypothetical protein
LSQCCGFATNGPENRPASPQLAHDERRPISAAEVRQYLALIGNRAGNAQEHHNSTVQPDNVLVGEAADMTSEPSSPNGRNLIDHQAAGAAQSVFHTRLDDQAK